MDSFTGFIEFLLKVSVLILFKYGLSNLVFYVWGVKLMIKNSEA